MSTLSVEEHAIKYRRLHQEFVALANRWFIPLGWRCENARVIVKPMDWRVWTLSGSGSPVPTFTIFDTIYVRSRWVNARTPVFGIDGDLSTPHGFAQLFHETWHAFECATRGKWWAVKEYGITMLQSWAKARKLWDHASSPFEQRAIEEAAKVQEFFELHRDKLKVFETLR